MANYDGAVKGEDDLFKGLDDIVLTTDEKSEIIESAVGIAEEHLRKNTPLDANDVKADRGTKKLYGKQIGHLREGITHKKHEEPDGSTRLGFNSKVYPIAVWTDWGTYRQPAQFWFENAFPTIPFDKFFAKQNETYKKILKRKGKLK